MGPSSDLSAANVDAAPAEPPQSLPPQDAAAHFQMESEVRELFVRGKNGAAWFYWIAVLSLINTVVAVSGGGIMFALGLDITMITDTIATEVALKPGGNMIVLIVALVFDAIMLGLLVLCGRLSQRRMLFVYALGMGLYLLDGILSLMLGSVVSIAIHGYALWSMWSGFAAYRQLNALEHRMLLAGAPSAGGP